LPSSSRAPRFGVRATQGVGVVGDGASDLLVEPVVAFDLEHESVVAGRLVGGESARLTLRRGEDEVDLVELLRACVAQFGESVHLGSP
jgi:hypothetical protein